MDIVKNRRINVAEFDAWMKEKGYKNVKVAEWLGISPNTFYNKRKGLNAFTVDEIKQLIGCGMTADWLDRIFGIAV